MLLFLLGSLSKKSPQISSLSAQLQVCQDICTELQLNDKLGHRRSHFCSCENLFQLDGTEEKSESVVFVCCSRQKSNILLDLLFICVKKSQQKIPVLDLKTS